MAEGRLSIGDSEAQAILTAYGYAYPTVLKLPQQPTMPSRIANDIGYPIVLKIASPDILHKTDVGGVKVGLENDEQLRDAYELMVYRAKRYVPDARIWGCLVQEMVPRRQPRNSGRYEPGQAIWTFGNFRSWRYLC